MRKKLILLLAFILAFTGCNSANEEEPTTSEVEGQEESDSTENEDAEGYTEYDLKDTYIVGLDDTFAPMGFRDDNGELVGFDIDLANAVGELWGVEMQFQPIDWTVKEQELNSGNIDFIWNGFSVTPEREEQLLLSDPYMSNNQIIATLADSPINTKADLAGGTVTVQGESSALEAVMSEADFVDSLAEPPIEYATNLECFKDIEAGRSDAIVVDEVFGRYYMELNGQENYKILEESFGDEVFAVGMRKEDTALADALNKALQELKDNGTYDEIYSKWFAEN